MGSAGEGDAELSAGELVEVRYWRVSCGSGRRPRCQRVQVVKPKDTDIATVIFATDQLVNLGWRRTFSSGWVCPDCFK